MKVVLGNMSDQVIKYMSQSLTDEVNQVRFYPEWFRLQIISVGLKFNLIMALDSKIVLLNVD